MSNEVYENGEEKETVEKPSLFGIITDPKTQFERIKENPKILVPFIIVTVLTIIGMLLMMTQIDFIGNDPLLNDMGEDELMIVTVISQITFVVVGLVTPAIAILINAAIYLIIAKIVKATVTFKQLFSMSVFIYVISVLSILVNALAFFAMSNPDPEMYLTSLNSIVGAEGVLGVILASIEIFAIWGMIITAMGLQIVAKFSKGLSWGVVISIFVVMLLFSIGGELVTNALGAF